MRYLPSIKSASTLSKHVALTKKCFLRKIVNKITKILRQNRKFVYKYRYCRTSIFLNFNCPVKILAWQKDVTHKVATAIVKENKETVFKLQRNETDVRGVLLCAQK